MNKKQYIVGHKNPLVATKIEYFNKDDKTLTLLAYHNPNFAAKFPTKEKAKQFIDNFIALDGIKILSFEGEQKKFDKWIKTGFLYRTLPIKNKFVSRKYKGESALEVLKWKLAYAKSDDLEVDYDDFETWPELWEKFEHLHDVEAYDDGSISFELYFPRGGKFKTFKKEFELALKHCTSEKNGDKCFSVYDHFLGEGGNFVYLVAKADGSYSVSDRHNDDIVSGDLKSCFNYLSAERWYG